MNRLLEKISGIIIRTQDYGETHKIVTIFSKKLGIFSALARGAKKPRSRMAAVTQPFIYGDYLVYVRKGLSTMQQGEIIHANRAIREDILKTAYATYIGELSYRLIEQKKPVPMIYDEFLRTLKWIAEKDHIEIPIMMYELKCYQEGGIAPILNRCVRCGQTNEPFLFSVAEGGLLCDDCKQLDPYATPLPKKVAKLLYLLATISLDQVGSINVKPENQQLMRRLLDLYYDQYGGYQIRSKKVLYQLLRLDQSAT